MTLTERHKERLLASWLRKCFKISTLRIMGGGKSGDLSFSVHHYKMLCMALLCTAFFVA